MVVTKYRVVVRYYDYTKHLQDAKRGTKLFASVSEAMSNGFGQYLDTIVSKYGAKSVKVCFEEAYVDDGKE
jgi:hypothetical protein